MKVIFMYSSSRYNGIKRAMNNMKNSTINALCGQICNEALEGEIDETKAQTIGRLCEDLWTELGRDKKYMKIRRAAMATIPMLIAGTNQVALAANGKPGDSIRNGFMGLIDVATAIAEPILWFYAVTACVLMATGHNKKLGWDKLKNVGYAYIGITMLPTLFAFLRWISAILRTSMNGVVK